MRCALPILAVLALAAGCSPDPSSGKPISALLADEQPSIPSVLEVPPGEMLQAVRQGYQPKPDRRFLLATADVHNLVTGEPTAPLQATWRDEAWMLRYEGDEVGRLPAIPDFEDISRLLEGWAERLLQARPRREAGPSRCRGSDMQFIESRLAAFVGVSLVEGLRRVDRCWRDEPLDPQLLSLAVEGLVTLQLQSYDPVEIGDALPAKALATLALTRVVSDLDLRREEALLAHEMGYTAHAARVASTLPAHDAVALYVAQRDAELEALAEAASAPPIVRYLYTLRLAERRDPEALLDWMERYGPEPHVFGLAQLKPVLATRRFESDAAFSPLVPYVALYDLWRGTGQLTDSVVERALEDLDHDDLSQIGLALRELIGVPQGILIQRFETDLAEARKEFTGPFLNGATYEAYVSAHLYSSIWQLAIHLLDGLASAGHARVLVAAMEGMPEAAPAELHRWYRHLSDATNGKPNVKDLMSDITELEHVGFTALQRTFDELRKNLEYADPIRIRAAKLMARRLDTRVSDQFALAKILWEDLHDLSGAEAYRRSVLRMAPQRHARLAIFMARLDGDTDGLLAMIDDAGMKLADRVYAFEMLVEGEPLADPETVKARGSLLIAVDPDDWDARHEYVVYLESQEAYEEAMRVLDGWLARNGPQAGFPYIIARTYMARLLCALGRYETAWEYVAPVARSYQAAAVGRAAVVLQALGEHEEALQYARALVDRYPTLGWGRAVLAEILWRQERYSEVAAVLHARGYPIGAWEWRDDVTEKFLSVFADRHLADTDRAFAALVDGGIPTYILENLSAGVAESGRNDIAFVMQSQLLPSGPLGSYRHPLWAYGYLKEMKGEDEALAWLRPRIPPGMLNPFSMEIYITDHHELLWTLIEKPELAEGASAVWLARTAAYVNAPERNAAYRERLLAHYEKEPGDDYDVMSQYLLGLADADALFALARSPDRRCEIAYYLGTKAKSEGRIRDAIDWFRVVVETEQNMEYEYYWAQRQLDEWANSGRSLERIANGT